MEDDQLSGEKDATEEQMVESGGLDSTEEGFIKGYEDDEEVIECAECGSAVPDEKKVCKVVNEESYTFCSEDCSKEFEEGMS
jgi:ribosomal protein S26